MSDVEGSEPVQGFGESDGPVDEDMDAESRIITTRPEDLAPEGFSSTEDIVMTGLRKASGWKFAVYDAGSAIIAVDDGTLVPDVRQFVNDYVESAGRMDGAIASMAKIASSNTLVANIEPAET